MDDDKPTKQFNNDAAYTYSSKSDLSDFPCEQRHSLFSFFAPLTLLFIFQQGLMTKQMLTN
jgi:hypothetical protein